MGCAKSSVYRWREDCDGACSIMSSHMPWLPDVVDFPIPCDGGIHKCVARVRLLLVVIKRETSFSSKDVEVWKVISFAFTRRPIPFVSHGDQSTRFAPMLALVADGVSAGDHSATDDQGTMSDCVRIVPWTVPDNVSELSLLLHAS
jgi:hypothetical protein